MCVCARRVLLMFIFSSSLLGAACSCLTTPYLMCLRLVGCVEGVRVCGCVCVCESVGVDVVVCNMDVAG